MLYVTGVVYHAAQFKAWGFPSYTGDININEMLIPSPATTAYFFYVLFFTVSLYWLLDGVKSFKSVGDKLANLNTDKLREDLKQIDLDISDDNIFENFDKLKNYQKAFDDERGKLKSISGKLKQLDEKFVDKIPKWLPPVIFMTITVPGLAAAIYWKQWEQLGTVLCSAISVCLMYKASKLKTYANGIAACGIFVIVTLIHTTFVGYYDAINQAPIPVLIQLESEKVVGIYYYEDSKNIYLIRDGKPVKLNKDRVTFIEK